MGIAKIRLFIFLLILGNACQQSKSESNKNQVGNNNTNVARESSHKETETIKKKDETIVFRDERDVMDYISKKIFFNYRKDVKISFKCSHDDGTCHLYYKGNKSAKIKKISVADKHFANLGIEWNDGGYNHCWVHSPSHYEKELAGKITGISHIKYANPLLQEGLEWVD